MEITGHLEAFNLSRGWVEIVTCPEWPPRRLRVHFQDDSALRGLAVFQLVHIEAREEQGKLLGISATQARAPTPPDGGGNT